MSLEIQICSWKEASHNQRESEVQRGLGHDGTKGYENLGCYECKGRKPECPSYIVVNEYEVSKN